MDFADRLRTRRKFLKLTQAQLAEKAGMAQQTIQQLETRKVLTTGRIVALAGGLGVRPEWLATGDGAMFPLLSADDQQLIEEISALEPEKKRIIRATIRAMLPSPIVPRSLLQAQKQSSATIGE